MFVLFKSAIIESIVGNYSLSTHVVEREDFFHKIEVEYELYFQSTIL